METSYVAVWAFFPPLYSTFKAAEVPLRGNSPQQLVDECNI